MSWDPDELPDMESMSEVPGSVLGTARDESVNDSVRDENELFGSVANNTQEVYEGAPSPLLRSDSEEGDDNEVSALHEANDGQHANTEFPFKAVLRAILVLKQAFL